MVSSDCNKRPVELDQRRAGGDEVAVLDEDLGDDAAIGMLHDLAVLFDLDLTAGDDRAGNLRRDRPAPKPPTRSASAIPPRISGARADGAFAGSVM